MNEIIDRIAARKAEAAELYGRLDMSVVVNAMLKELLINDFKGSFKLGFDPGLARRHGFDDRKLRGVAANVAYLDDGRRVELPRTIDRFTGETWK